MGRAGVPTGDFGGNLNEIHDYFSAKLREYPSGGNSFPDEVIGCLYNYREARWRVIGGYLPVTWRELKEICSQFSAKEYPTRGKRHNSSPGYGHWLPYVGKHLWK